MPADSKTAAQVRLLDTTAVLMPASRSSRTHATDPGNGLDTVTLQLRFDQSLLTVARLQIESSAGRRVRTALRERDATRSQEIADSCLARLAVDVHGIVGLVVEARRARSVQNVPRRQKVIEGLRPRGRVDSSGRSQHTVKVEQHGIVMVHGENRGHSLSLLGSIHSTRRESSRVEPWATGRRDQGECHPATYAQASGELSTPTDTIQDHIPRTVTEIEHDHEQRPASSAGMCSARSPTPDRPAVTMPKPGAVPGSPCGDRASHRSDAVRSHLAPRAGPTRAGRARLRPRVAPAKRLGPRPRL